MRYFKKVSLADGEDILESFVADLNNIVATV